MGKPSLALLVAAAAIGARTPVAAQEMGSVLREQAIASGTGGFGGALDDVDHFGHALVSLGDLDGDGVEDLAVGAPDDDDGGVNRGALWILFLEADGSVRIDMKVSAMKGGFPGTLRNADHFGCALASLGDLDGDGMPELAVGAEADDDGGLDRGAVWILSLSADGRAPSARKISQTSGGFTGSLRNGDRFGGSLAALTDLDGDGVGELAVGAALDDDGGTDRGAVWVLFLNADGSVRAQTKVSSTSGGLAGPLDDADGFGRSLAALGDLDGDGRGELAIGADQDDDGGTNAGAAWILFLHADGSVRAEAKLAGPTAPPLHLHDHFGAALAAPGDVDGDGTADLAVGAPLDDDGGLNAGAVWILFLDPAGGMRGSTKLSAAGGGLAAPAPGDQFGCGLAALGDLDGDRKIDLAAGAEANDTGGRDRGQCRALFLESAELADSGGLVVRNGLGVNPVILSADAPPVVGSAWEVRVDCTGFRHGVVLHVAVDGPFEGRPFGRRGQVLIDLRRRPLLRALARHAGTETRIVHRVPASPALVGLSFYSQAMVTGTKGARLTNALDGVFQAATH